MTSGTRPPLLLPLLCAALLGAGAAALRAQDAPAVAPPLPTHLRDTGLYADPANASWNAPVAPGLIAFSPQYPLWSDGSHKRRWLSLPPGTAVDARDPAAWQFPPGTRFWKEFAFDGPVETRMIERLADGSWRYAAYVWNADGTDAVLAPEAGIASVPSQGGPRADYAIPSRADCRGCHEGASVPPLGFAALQLSGDRDALAPHADAAPPGGGDWPDLRSLAADGVLANVPAHQLATPPRVDAGTPVARAALGYLHANCGHCHHRGAGRVPVPLALAQEWADGRADAGALLASSVDREGRYRLRGADAGARLVAPGHPESSTVALRMGREDPLTRMPPVGTRVVDTVGVELVRRWIADLPPVTKETTP